MYSSTQQQADKMNILLVKVLEQSGKFSVITEAFDSGVSVSRDGGELNCSFDCHGKAEAQCIELVEGYNRCKISGADGGRVAVYEGSTIIASTPGNDWING